MLALVAGSIAVVAVGAGGILLAGSGGHPSRSAAQQVPAPVGRTTGQESTGPVPTTTQPMVTAAETQTVVQTTSPPPDPYQTYRDSEFGFSVQLPGEYLQQASSGSAVASYQSSDGRAVVRVFRQGRSAGLDAAGAEATSETSFRGQGGRPTYTFHSDQNYIVSGYTAGGDVYYEFGYLGASELAGFRWTYPASAKATTDPLVTHAYQSFESGSL